MNESLDDLKRLLDGCSAEELLTLFDHVKERLPQHPQEKEWGVSADVILSAIARSTDLTKRGVRGIIAEAIFESHTLAGLKGWESVNVVGDHSYDFLIRSKGLEAKEIRIQVKLQRMKAQRPMLASEGNRHYPNDMHVVEVQKTRGGIDAKTKKDTRPYHFDEFDILAVNMQPSTRKWERFMFTVGRWLLPRNLEIDLIEKFQPVPDLANAVWTDNLETCIEWLAAGEEKRVLDIDLNLLNRRKKKRKRSKRRRKVRK
jgi:hypothetical protein